MIGWKPKFYDPAVASARYRCFSPLQTLQARGLPVELFDPAKEASYRVVVLSKLYDRAHQALARRARERGAKVVLDICDDHFYNPFGLPAYTQAKADLLAMLPLADKVVCSTAALADVVQEEAGLRVRPSVIGDAIEAPRAAREPPAAGPVRLLWFGFHGAPNAPCGMLDLLTVADRLARQAARGHFELVVSSNNREKYEQSVAPLPFATRYDEWNEASFPALLSSSDAVLIPITLNRFTACKSNNRLGLALAYAVPVIADRIGSYEEFAPYCYLDRWDDGLAAVLARDPSAAAMAVEGRRHVLGEWSAEVVHRGWEDLLGELSTE